MPTVYSLVQQVMTEDPTVCEYDEVNDGIGEGRKKAVYSSKTGQEQRIETTR